MPTKLSRICDGLLEAAWLGAIILIPIFFNVYSSRIFEPDKIAILRSLAILTLGAWLVKVLEEGQVRWERMKPEGSKIKSILTTPLVGLPLALAILYLISTIFSVSPRVSLWGSYQRLQGTYTTLSYIIIFASIVVHMRRRAQVERFITMAILTSLPISLYGILQRYKLDPIPWGGDVSYRIASNMGNSIFVAAYLIMSFPLTIGRVLQTFRAILQDKGWVWGQVARGTVYVFLLAVQLIALYMSGSRGPALGWLASSVFLFLLLSVYWRKRWLAYSIIGVGVVAGAFLLLLNIPNGPLETLRISPAIGRFGLLLDSQSNSAKVRQYIWEGAVKLVSPHEPLTFPDGSKDAFNVLRPLIGYGPESMYVAYNPFYVPELGQVEKRNASPDRSHNETWDSIVITGILGLIAYLALFTAVFYYGYKWLGLIPEQRHRNIFFVLVAAGGLLGAAVMILWRGIEYLGVGLPFGMVLGLVLYMGLAAILFQANGSGETALDPERSLILIVLLTAILAHFIEINFGIAIVATRTYFWTYAAVMLVVGYIMPKYGEYSAPNVAVLEKEAANVKSTISTGRAAVKPEVKGSSVKSKARRKVEREISSVERRPAWLSTALTGGFLVALVLVTLGYNYISNSARATSALSILSSSFTSLPNQPNTTAYGILALILTTWLGMSIVLTTEGGKEQINGDQTIEYWKTLGVMLAVSMGSAFIFWMWQAGSLASLASMVPTNQNEVLDQVAQIAGLLTNLYIFIFLVLAALAMFSLRDFSGKLGSGGITGKIAAPVVFLVVIGLVSVTNLRIIHADISYKMAEPFTNSNQWPMATILYRQALQQAPDEDFYYLFLGRSYLEQAKLVKDEASLEQLVLEAESDLKTAQAINPLNTDHTANLGRLYSWWASRTTDSTKRIERAKKASDYYALAVTLSPQNSTLWGEWAILFMDVLNQPDEALSRLTHALELDKNYEWTQNLMGNYYLRQAQAITETVKHKELLEKAAVYFEDSMNAESSYPDNQVKSNSALALADIRRQLGDLDKAIEAYDLANRFAPSSSNVWKIQATIAQLYLQTGNKAKAQEYLDLAMKSAPSDQKTQLQPLAAQIQAQP